MNDIPVAWDSNVTESDLWVSNPRNHYNRISTPFEAELVRAAAEVVELKKFQPGIEENVYHPYRPWYDLMLRFKNIPDIPNWNHEKIEDICVKYAESDKLWSDMYDELELSDMQVREGLDDDVEHIIHNILYEITDSHEMSSTFNYLAEKLGFINRCYEEAARSSYNAMVDECDLKDRDCEEE